MIPDYVKLDKYGLVPGGGDTIWKTAMAAITYNDFKLWDSIDNNCIGYVEIFKVGIKFWRSPEYWKNGEDTVSRDQLTMFFVSTKLLFGRNYYLNIKWRISKKYKQTLDFWMWKEALKSGVYGFLMNWLFQIVMIPFMILMMIWNWLLLPFLNNVNLKDYKLTPRKDLNRLQKVLVDIVYPPITLHLFAWQVYVLRWTPFKPILKAIIRLMSPDWNILIKLLTYGKVTVDDINAVPNYSSFIWQRWANVWNDCTLEILSEEEYLKKNFLLKDICYAMFKLKYK